MALFSLPQKVLAFRYLCLSRFLRLTLHFTHCTLHFALNTLYFALHPSHFTLDTPYSTLYTLHTHTLYTLDLILYTLRFTLHTGRSTLTLYTPHCTRYTLLSTLHTLLYTLHFKFDTWHSTIYTPHSTLYTLRIILYTWQPSICTINKCVRVSIRVRGLHLVCWLNSSLWGNTLLEISTTQAGSLCASLACCWLAWCWELWWPRPATSHLPMPCAWVKATGHYTRVNYNDFTPTSLEWCVGLWVTIPFFQITGVKSSNLPK